MQLGDKMMGFPEYIEALEGERRKIQVFHRELPLSLELITQAIETCKQQLSGTTTEDHLNGQSECNSEQTSTEEGPVFEEFIPIKKRPSSPHEHEDDDVEQHSHHRHKISRDDKKKSDWLRSVQLWNPDPFPAKEDHVPRKASVVEVKRNNGGAFQPFHREEKANHNNASPPPPAVINIGPSSPLVPASSSTGPLSVAGGSIKREEKVQGQRKQRRCWSQELHKRFLQVLQQLGGPDSATPKQIRELMKVDGLTNDEVKSHLQKFRLHTRRPSSMIPNSANSQTAPLFLVGNIFVQPPEYAAVATTSTASGELTTVTASASPGGIYAPVAAHPPLKNPQMKRLEISQNSHSDERGNHSEGAVHSNSPAASSCSTHTTTTSPSGC